MKSNNLLVLLLIMAFASFTPSPKRLFTFEYPKAKNTVISFDAGHFKNFSKEWRGSDYYYLSEADGFVCSVLYYKLSEEERKELIDDTKAALNAPDASPIYPYTYFKNASNLKAMERNDSSWGGPNDDFMFRQNNVVIEGTRFSQKNMYAYGMFGKDLFVNVHISKPLCSSSDSTEMMALLKSLVKAK